jgi:hypothetical protein
MTSITRKLAVLRFTLLRGYSWCQIPVLSVLFAGNVKMFFPSMNIWFLGVTSFCVFLGVGFLDKKLKILNEELNYGTEKNDLLMSGLKGELKQ